MKYGHITLEAASTRCTNIRGRPKFSKIDTTQFSRQDGRLTGWWQWQTFRSFIYYQGRAIVDVKWGSSGKIQWCWDRNTRSRQMALQTPSRAKLLTTSGTVAKAGFTTIHQMGIDPTQPLMSVNTTLWANLKLRATYRRFRGNRGRFHSNK